MKKLMWLMESSTLETDVYIWHYPSGA